MLQHKDGGRECHRFYVAFDQKRKKEKFNGQQVGAAESKKRKTKRKEDQFQLTYAKVKVISMDKEEDKQGEKEKLS